MPEPLFSLSCRAEACNFIKEETLAQVFPMNFAKFLRRPFIVEHLWWLLLEVLTCLIFKLQTIQEQCAERATGGGGVL